MSLNCVGFDIFIQLNVNQTRWSGVTLLHRYYNILMSGNKYCLLRLIVFVIYHYNDRAAENGFTDCCELLLEFGANINAKTTWGWYTRKSCHMISKYTPTTCANSAHLSSSPTPIAEQWLCVDCAHATGARRRRARPL